MSEIPFIQFYPGDYFKDTVLLTTEQHGAYLLLLFSAWGRKDCKLPDDDQLLARATRLSVRKWKSIKPVIMEFFEVENGYLFNLRLLSEHQKATHKRDKKADAGRLGGNAKSLNNNNTGSSKSNVLPLPESKQTPSKSEPEPESYKKEKKGRAENKVSSARPYPDGFDLFWRLWRSKGLCSKGDNKKQAYSEWSKLTQGEQDRAASRAGLWQSWFQADHSNGTTMLYGVRYLRRRCFDDLDDDEKPPQQQTNGHDTRPDWVKDADDYKKTVGDIGDWVEEMRVAEKQEEAENGNSN